MMILNYTKHTLIRLKMLSIIFIISFFLICCIVLVYLPHDTLEIHFKRESIEYIELISNVGI